MSFWRNFNLRFWRNTTEFTRDYKTYGADWLYYTDLAELYNTISAIRMVVDIKANAEANMRFIPVDKNGDEIKDPTDEQKRVINLIKRPNPIHSTWEFIKLHKTFKEIWGRAYIYGSTRSGFDVEGKNMSSLMIVPTQYMYPQYTGRLFDTINRKDVISSYKYEFDGRIKKFNVDEILDRADTNICFYDQIREETYNVNSYTKLSSINYELTNYVKALEGRNVTVRKLGARGVFTSGKKDAMGVFPLSDTEKLKAQGELNKFGAMEDQNQYIVTTTPLQYQNIAFSPKELMLMEENWHTMIAICNVFGVPPDLLKLYVKGDADNKNRETYKRLYEQTIIPESKDFEEDINSFLKTEKYGMRFVASFDHLDILQEDKKDESIKNRNINIAHRDMFKAGAIKYNTWLKAMGLPLDSNIGEKRIFDLTPEQQSVILGKVQQDIPKG